MYLTEVQRRAYAEALRISNERALAAEKQRADLAEQALRITEQSKVIKRLFTLMHCNS